MFGDQPQQHVERAARRLRHDDFHRAGGVIGGLGSIASDDRRVGGRPKKQSPSGDHVDTRLVSRARCDALQTRDTQILLGYQA